MYGTLELGVGAIAEGDDLLVDLGSGIYTMKVLAITKGATLEDDHVYLESRELCVRLDGLEVMEMLCRDTLVPILP